MIEQGARLFGTLVVAVGVNSNKRPTFSLGERLQMLKVITKHFKNVKITSYSDEYLVRYALRMKASHVLRGIRSAQDFAYEQTLRHINSDMDKNITTVFLTPPRILGETSSAIVKSMIGPVGWQQVIETMVPKGVAKALPAKFG